METAPIIRDEQQIAPEIQIAQFVDTLNFAEYATPKDAAIHLSQKMGSFLSQTFPAIANTYREKPLCSQSRIARKIFPEAFFLQHQRLAEAAVEIALRTLIPEQEYRQLVIDHRKALETRRLEEGYYQTDYHREKSAQAALLKHLKETPEQRAETSDRLNLAQGKTPWTTDELYYLKLNFDNPSFYHQKGQHRGKLDLIKLAQALNEKFGNNRNRKTLFQFLKRNNLIPDY